MENPCAKSELLLFDRQETQIAVEESRWSHVYPVNPIKGEPAPIEFVIPGTELQYLDLNDTMLYVKLSLKSADDQPPKVLTTGGNVAPVNMLLSSLFSDVSLAINDTVVEGEDYNYAYRAYLSTLLGFSNETKSTQIFGAGWVKDVAGKMNDVTNEGHKTRAKWLSKTKMEFMGPLFLGLLCQSKYLLPKCKITIRLMPQKEEFYIMSFAGARVKVELHSVYLKIRTVKVAPSVHEAHMKGMEKFNAYYPIQRVRVSSYTIPKGTFTESRPILQSADCPKLVVIAFVKNCAYHGNWKENPFNFQHFSLNHLSLIRNGSPVEAFKLDFAKDECLAPYMSMFQNLELYNRDETNGITFAEYKDGYTLFTYNLTPDLSYSGSYGQTYKQTHLRLDMEFREALPDSVNIILYCLYDGAVEINALSEVTKF